MRKKLLSMLALLCLTVTSAWAQEGTLLTTILSASNADFEYGSRTFDNIATVTFSGFGAVNGGDEYGWYSDEGCTLTVTAAEGYTITRVKFYTDSGSAFDEEAPFEAFLDEEWYTKVNGTSIGDGGVTKIEVYGYANAVAGYSVTFKEGTEDATSWQGKAGEGEYQALPLEGVAAGTVVSVKYNGTKKVKSVTVVKKAETPAGPTYDETKSINDGPVTVAAGEHWLITGTGTETTNTMSIAAGATVTLDGVNISSSGYCIKCAGSATIILKDGSTNTLTSTSDEYPALSIGDAGTTLTIQGSTGVLNVTSGENSAGIGGGYMNNNNTCGNIRIEGGVITATGGDKGAGIGSDCGPATCGDIIITGGTITAKGGGEAAGIGSGNGDGDASVCGDITIANTVTKVTATKGEDAPYSIGKGYGSNASCGTVTIGGTKYWENNAAVGDGATYLAQDQIVYQP